MQQACFPFLPFGCSHFYQDGYNSRSQKQAAQGHCICYTFSPLSRRRGRAMSPALATV